MYFSKIINESNLVCNNMNSYILIFNNRENIIKPSAETNGKIFVQ